MMSESELVASGIKEVTAVFRVSNKGSRTTFHYRKVPAMLNTDGSCYVCIVGSKWKLVGFYNRITPKEEIMTIHEDDL